MTSPSRAVSSMGTTPSAPAGMGAPVMIAIASPVASGRAACAPAATSPAQRSVAGAAANGVAVDQALVEWRIVAVGGEVLREVEAARFAQGHADNSRRHFDGVEDGQRLLNGFEVGHVGFAHDGS